MPRPEPAKPPENESAPPGLPETDPAELTAVAAAKVTEIGGPSGPDPTRFGDWERGGRCIDF